MKDPAEELDELAFKLFKIFSRWEFALKAAGYLRKDKRGQYKKSAEADWNSFALTMEEKFKAETADKFSKAVSYLHDQPPRKQVVIGDKLCWDDGLPSYAPRNIETTLFFVRRVRNNLFHGGKFNTVWFAPERSEPLIRHSLTILEWCKNNADEDIKEKFEYGEYGDYGD